MPCLEWCPCAASVHRLTATAAASGASDTWLITTWLPGMCRDACSPANCCIAPQVHRQPLRCTSHCVLGRFRPLHLCCSASGFQQPARQLTNCASSFLCCRHRPQHQLGPSVTLQHSAAQRGSLDPLVQHFRLAAPFNHAADRVGPDHMVAPFDSRTCCSLLTHNTDALVHLVNAGTAGPAQA